MLEAVHEAKKVYREVIKYDSQAVIIRKTYAIEIRVGSDVLCFVSYNFYYRWCKGKTYYINGRMYHSGYEMEERNKND